MSDHTVLHLITRYLNGGAETTTRNTIEALHDAEENYDLRLGTGVEHDAERLSRLNEEGVDTVVFRSLRHYNPLGAVVAVFAVAWYLRRHDVKVLHTHSTEAGIVGRWAGALVGTPVVVHEIHGDPIASDRNRILNAFLLVAERISAPLATRLVVKSERIRETYLDRGIGRREQYELIYHGVDLTRFGERQTDQSGEALELLFVGRLAEGKGLHDLLDAVARLQDVHLRLVGDGSLADDLSTEAERRDLPVELLGYRDDIPELMASADVLVIPSYREGTPRVITEAMATGLPVVATDIAGIPEQVVGGETGFLVEPGNVDALVACLRSLRDPDLRREMGEKASERVGKFSIKTAQERYRALYAEFV